MFWNVAHVFSSLLDVFVHRADVFVILADVLSSLADVFDCMYSYPNPRTNPWRVRVAPDPPDSALNP